MSIAEKLRAATPFRIADLDPRDDLGFSRDDAERRYKDNIDRLQDLQYRLWAERKHGVLVVLQGMDAAGKGGTVSKVFGKLFPECVRVHSFKAPTRLEREHDFLWRIHQKAPGRGHIAVFDRSHYEDVLIVRVEGLAPEERWRARFEHIRAFEASLSTEGTTVVKFFLNLSKDEQHERLVERIHDPRKNWKYSADDFAKRKKWDAYMEAYEEAITRTSTDESPWYAIPCDRKWVRNLAVSEIVAETIERLEPRLPRVDLSEQEMERLLADSG